MQHRRVTTFVLALLFAVGTFAVASPAAHASTRWSTGVKVSSTFTYSATTWGMYKSTCPSYYGLGAVRVQGDYLYVKDTCKDGKSAFVEWRDGKETTQRWICLNSRGKGTVVRCNFDWPERAGTLIVGKSDGRRIAVRDHGASIHLDNNGRGETYPCGFC